MTISEIVPSEVIETVGVTEDVAEFDNKERTFNKGQLLRQGKYVYERVGDDFVAPDFNSDNSYELNDIVYKDNKLQYVSAISGDVAKQPENYDSVDTDFDPNNWQNRYLYIGEFSDVDTNEAPANYILKKVHIGSWWCSYSFYKTDDTILTKVRKDLILSDTTYYNEDNRKEYLTVNSDLGVYFYLYRVLEPGGNTILVQKKLYPNRDGLNNTTLYLDRYGELHPPADLVETDKASYHKLDKAYYKRETTQFFNSSSLEKTEEKAVVEHDCFIPKCFILRGNKLYMRTNVSTSVEIDNLASITFSELNSLDVINWGWSKLRPTKQYAPFDEKKYTFVEENNNISYKLKANDSFDVIALNGLIASKVDIKINGQTVASKVPKCKIIRHGKSFVVSSTTVIYLQQEYPKDVVVEIYIHTLNKKVRLGGLYLGDYVVAGFTNLQFKNYFIDYSPFEKDKWGNITYVDGVKVRVFEGSAAIELKEYDDINPLLQNFLGKKTIFDGSDNIENKETDSKDYFSSTLIIGRVRNFEQETMLEDNELAQIAKYNFKIEEDV